MGYLALFEGDVESATRLQREALRTLHGVAGYDFAIVYIIEAMAIVALAARQPSRRVARLLGAAAVLRQGLGYPLAAVLRGADLESVRKQVRADLGAAAYEAEFEAGAALTLDQVYEEALQEYAASAEVEMRL
jgi:hypothetical protein